MSQYTFHHHPKETIKVGRGPPETVKKLKKTTASKQNNERGPGKGPGKNKKGKAPVKRGNNVTPSDKDKEREDEFRRIYSKLELLLDRQNSNADRYELASARNTGCTGRRRSKSLAPPKVNPEIWHLLNRQARSDDLSFQTIQRILGFGIVPVIRTAEALTKPDAVKTVAKMRVNINNALSMLCAAFFEISYVRHDTEKQYGSEVPSTVYKTFRRSNICSEMMCPRKLKILMMPRR
ncbi:unnamed protein product [Mytilus edulis]|uniref:Uncharacterized protein n=1 Tax=Mytilus edulis TaxID=6550 RepID=A0A8S3TSM3_MYTED|nr:unnamed protein product [Mytilus edulis]